MVRVGWVRISPSLVRCADRYCRKALFIFWGIVVGIGVCINMISAARRSLCSEASANLEGASSSRHVPLYQRYWSHIRAYFLLPATFSKTCNEHSWFGTIPPRAETAIIGLYIGLNVILSAVLFEAFDDNIYYEDNHSIQIWGTFPDRMGYLSYANLTIFFLFGIRNNILLWMTGWTFATFNRFHRWVARISTLQAVLHSVGYTVFEFEYGGFASYAEAWKEEYW